MTISTRHIRHDWNTFVDWEQKSVRTMCGTTTRRGLAGIPGITVQPEIVQLKDKKVWGWCSACVRSTIRQLRDIEDEEVCEAVKQLYSQATDAIYGQYNWLVEKARADRARQDAQRQARLAKDAGRV